MNKFVIILFAMLLLACCIESTPVPETSALQLTEQVLSSGFKAPRGKPRGFCLETTCSRGCSMRGHSGGRCRQSGVGDDKYEACKCEA